MCFWKRLSRWVLVCLPILAIILLCTPPARVVLPGVDDFAFSVDTVGTDSLMAGDRIHVRIPASPAYVVDLISLTAAAPCEADLDTAVSSDVRDDTFEVAIVLPCTGNVSISYRIHVRDDNADTAFTGTINVYVKPIPPGIGDFAMSAAVIDGDTIQAGDSAHLAIAAFPANFVDSITATACGSSRAFAVSSTAFRDTFRVAVAVPCTGSVQITYRLHVNDGTIDTAFAGTIHLTVLDTSGPVDTTHLTAPADVNVTRLDTGRVQITWTGSPKAVAYTVYYNPNRRGGMWAPTDSGADTIAIDTTRFDCYYFVVAEDADGNHLASSDTVKAPALTGPSITSQPADRAVSVGDRLVFRVAATGSTPLAYAWTKGGNAISGTLDSLVLAAAQKSDAGFYSCTVTDSKGMSASCTTWTLTVADTLPLTFGFTNTSASAVETAYDTIKVRLSRPADSVVTVDVALTTGGSAVEGDDFTFADASLTFRAGDTVKAVLARINTDTVRNGDRDFRLILRNPDGATLSADTLCTYTIIDDEQLSVAFGSAKQSVDETAGSCSLLVRLSIPAAAATSVGYRVAAGGSAVRGADFSGDSGSLSFSAGVVAKYAVVTIHDNNVRDSSRTFFIELTLPQGSSAVLGTTVRDTVTITDNERVSASFGHAADTVTEPTSGTATLNLPVELSCPVAWPVSVTYAIKRAGTATATDYTLAAGPLTIPAGETTGVIAVTIASDDTVESAEYAIIGLSAITPGDTLGAQTEDSMVIIDRASLTVGFASTDRSKGENGASDNIAVVLSRPATFAVTVNYTFANGTAVKGTDYNGTNGTLTFNPGDTVESIPVTLIDNSTQEGNRLFTIALASPTGATIGANQTCVYTITDDEQLSVGFATGSSQGAESKSPCSLAVDLSTTSSQATVITYRIAAGGTAEVTAGDTDFVLTTTTLNIPAGTTRGYIVFTVTNDAVNEDNESFTVELLSATNGATVDTARDTHAYTIQDNDALTVAFKRTSLAVDEGSAASDTVILNTASELGMTVEFLRTAGSAVQGRDYILSASPVSFAAGETQKTIGVTTLANALNTDTLSIVLTLQNPLRGSLGSQSQNTVVINDADAAPAVSLSCASTVNEGAALTVTVGLDDSTGRTVKVFWRTAGISAVTGTDFEAKRDSATFYAGYQTPPIQQQFAVNAPEDSLDDDSLTFSVQVDSVVRIRGSVRKKDASTPAARTVKILDNDAIPSNVIVVNWAATGKNTGLCWRDAFTSLDSALDYIDASATRKEVWAAKGSYRPKTLSGFSMPPGSLYGGFVGGEIVFSQRDRGKLLRENMTTLSGDLNGNQGFDQSIDADYAVAARTSSPTGGLVFDGIAFSCAASGLRASDGRTYTVQNCLYKNDLHDRCIEISASVNSTISISIRNAVFVGNSTSMAIQGYESYSTMNVSVRNSIFYGFTTQANSCVTISAYNGKKVFENCSFVKNNRAVGQAVLRTAIDTLANCILWNNATPNLPMLFGSFVDRTIIDTTGIDPSMVDGWQQNGCTNIYNDNTTGTPAFVAVDSVFGADGLLGGDTDGLLLQPGDPGITFGSDAYAPDDDILGSPRRKLNHTCTAGAYEQK